MSHDQRRRPPSPRRHHDGDMYRFRGDGRQNTSRHDFEFRASGYPAASFPPSGPASQRNVRRGYPNNRGRARGGFKRPGPSERALLRTRRSPTPEQLVGMNSMVSAFRPLEELSNSDGEDKEDPAMGRTSPIHAKLVPTSQQNENSSSDEEEDHPRAKRAKTGIDGLDAKPKWSNPDPYTALPPPGESQGPKTDVLKMIRKAKVQNGASTEQAPAVDEFISLNFGDEEDGEVSSDSEDDDMQVLSHRRRDDYSVRGAARERGGDTYRPDEARYGDRWAPSDRGFAVRGGAERDRYVRRSRSRSRSPPRRDFGHNRYSTSPESFDRRRSRYSPPPHDRYSRHSPPPRDRDRYYSPPRSYGNSFESDKTRSDLYGRVDALRHAYASNSPQHPVRAEMKEPHPPVLAGSHPGSAAWDVWPPPPPPLTESLPVPPPVTGVSIDRQKRKRAKNDGSSAGPGLASSWLPRGDGTPTPWMAYCTSEGTSPDMWLHDELQNFYFYASPRAVERHMRADLIDRVTRAFSNESQRITVRTFGSSATNLYLPTGDVDLVVLSAHYRATGRPNIPVNRAALNRFVRNNITGTGLGISPQVIPAAKVPIIKFTDKKTGLPVDVSFENDSGVAALNTLDDWSEEYPALKRLVFPIKQLLKMRGLNEVNTGGLGGFSSICLVAFRLHHLSVTKSSQWSMENLDLALLDILDFYSTFDLEVDGLDMRSMSIIPKASFQGFRPSKPGRLLIVDPNNSENDISGGTGKIKDIFAMFKSAAQSLRTELEMARNVRFTGSARWSMLNCILGGDYSSFELQRQRLEALSSSETRSTTMQIDLTASDGEYSPADVPVPAPQALIARIPTISVVPSQNGGRFDVPGPPRQPAKQAPPKTKAKQKSVAKKQQPPAVSDSVPATRSSKRKTTNQQQDPPRPAKKAKQNKSKSDQSGVPVNGQPPKESNPPETKKSKAKKKRDMAAASRVSSFKQQFPGVPCPEKMDKIQYRQMVKQQTQAQTAH